MQIFSRSEFAFQCENFRDVRKRTERFLNSDRNLPKSDGFRTKKRNGVRSE